MESGYPEKWWDVRKNDTFACCPVCLYRPLKNRGMIWLSNLVVPRTASGLQGE